MHHMLQPVQLIRCVCRYISLMWYLTCCRISAHKIAIAGTVFDYNACFAEFALTIGRSLPMAVAFQAQAHEASLVAQQCMTAYMASCSRSA